MAHAVVIAVAGTVRFVLQVILRWKRTVVGTENIPSEGGCILTFNHNSYTDFFVTGVTTVWPGNRDPRFLIKAELFNKPILGWIFRTARQIPVARGARSGRQAAFSSAIEALQQGEVIMMAPEQTISESFDLLPFSTGAVRMAQGAGVPIVPSVSWGTQRFLTKSHKRGRAFGLPILVKIGEPFHVPPDADPVEMTEKLQEAVAALLDEVIAEYPDRPTPGDDWWWPERLGGSAPNHQEFLARFKAREEEWRGNK